MIYEETITPEIPGLATLLSQETAAKPSSNVGAGTDTEELALLLQIDLLLGDKEKFKKRLERALI